MGRVLASKWIIKNTNLVQKKRAITYLESSIISGNYAMFVFIVDFIDVAVSDSVSNSVSDSVSNIENILALVKKVSTINVRFRTWLDEYYLKYEFLNILQLLDERVFSQSQMIRYFEYVGFSDLIRQEGLKDLRYTNRLSEAHFRYYQANKGKGVGVDISWGLDRGLDTTNLIIVSCIINNYSILLNYFFELLSAQYGECRYGQERAAMTVCFVKAVTKIAGSSIVSTLLNINLDYLRSLHEDPWDKEMKIVCEQFTALVEAIAPVEELEKNIERQIICRGNLLDKDKYYLGSFHEGDFTSKVVIFERTASKLWNIV